MMGAKRKSDPCVPFRRPGFLKRLCAAGLHPVFPRAMQTTAYAITALLVLGCGGPAEEDDDGGIQQHDARVQRDARQLPDAANTQPTECSRLDLLIQNECGSGRRCTILSGEPMGSNVTIGCTAPGSLSAWSSCIPTLPDGPDDCEAGTVCADLLGTGIPLCHPFCESRYGYCESGLCGVHVTLPDNDPPIFLCIPDTPCDPIYDDGCPTSLSCYWSPKAPDVTTCIPAGTKSEGTSCTYHSECVPWHTCYGEPGDELCRELCEEGATGFCAGDYTCTETGSEDFGVCLPSSNFP